MELLIRLMIMLVSIIYKSITGNHVQICMPTLNFTVPVWPQHEHPAETSGIQTRLTNVLPTSENNAGWALTLVPTEPLINTPTHNTCSVILTQKCTVL